MRRPGRTAEPPILPDEAACTNTGAARGTGDNLRLRVASALVMGIGALAATVVGGWLFVAFWTVAALGAFAEWLRLVRPKDAGPWGAAVLAGGSAMVLGGAGVMLAGQGEPWALTGTATALMAGAAAMVLLAPATKPGWSLAGFLYCAVFLCAIIALRGAGAGGFDGVVFLFAIVWGADSTAYLIGRNVGGPKFWPRISPNKTWSGTIGGIFGAVLCGLLWLTLRGVPILFVHAAAAAALAIGAIAGDLVESALKRHFGAKDAGHLIPGHGGLLDRLDSFILACILAAGIGLAAGESVSSGLSAFVSRP